MNSFLEASTFRDKVVSARDMLTANALVRGEDELGLLALSNRRNESVARAIQQNPQ